MRDPARPALTLNSAATDPAEHCFELARSGQTAELEQLVREGASPDLANDKGDTLLILASYHGHHETAAMLLARGADPNHYNGRGQTALAAAAFKGAERVVLALLGGGASVDASGPEGRTALMVAAMFDRTAIVDLLLESGADPDRTDEESRRAIDHAKAMKAYGTPRLLQEASDAKAKGVGQPL